VTDLEDKAFIGFLVAVGLLAVLLLVLFAFFVRATVRDWSAESDCRERDGKVEYYDPEHKSLWRCVAPTPERAP
jgi:hypothetical protein